VATPTATTFNDSGLSASMTYLYRVKAVDGSSHVGPPSQPEFATTIVFTDDPLVAGSTTVKALHFTQLRTAIDAVRAATGQGAATYTNAITADSLIRAVDVTEMRSFLDAARGAIGVPAIQYTDPTLTLGSTIVKAPHIQELRAGVK